MNSAIRGAISGHGDHYDHSSDNPFRERLRQRQAAMGGKHRASQYLDGKLAREEEQAVAFARDARLLADVFVSPF